MKITSFTLVVIAALTLSSCRKQIEQEVTDYSYYDIPESDTLEKPILLAVTDEEFLQYGSKVAYLNLKGDTIIPFGKYAYYGTDTMIHYANVIEHPHDSAFGRQIGINRDQKILFDLVMFDNGPEPFNEGYIRVIRNGKMGYANERGRVVIPCIYDYAKWFQNGKAEVTFDAVEYSDMDEHKRVESDEWFEIDKKGNKIMNFDLIEEIDAYIKKGNLKEAIQRCESKLEGLEVTYFHPIIRQDLLHHTSRLAQWLEEFYLKVSMIIQVQALYLEMNGFDVNTDMWYIDGFAYKQIGTSEDFEWLTECNSDTATDEPFILTGFEMMQVAFEQYFDEEDASENLEAAHDIAEMLVILRLQELVAQIHKEAKAKELSWNNIPVFATAHGYEVIYKSR